VASPGMSEVISKFFHVLKSKMESSSLSDKLSMSGTLRIFGLLSLRMQDF
jgi:hypothetical protein